MGRFSPLVPQCSVQRGLKGKKMEKMKQTVDRIWYQLFLWPPGPLHLLLLTSLGIQLHTRPHVHTPAFTYSSTPSSQGPQCPPYLADTDRSGAAPGEPGSHLQGLASCFAPAVSLGSRQQALSRWWGGGQQKQAGPVVVETIGLPIPPSLSIRSVATGVT